MTCYFCIMLQQSLKNAFMAAAQNQIPSSIRLRGVTLVRSTRPIREELRSVDPAAWQVQA